VAQVDMRRQARKLPFPTRRLRPVQRFDHVEPLVMLATVLQWLVLAPPESTIAEC